MKKLLIWISLFTLSALACGAQATLPEYNATQTPTEISTEVSSVEMVVVAENLNIRADQTEKSPADPQGLKRGDVVKVYLACTGGRMRDWLAINRDCTRWVKASWLIMHDQP